MSKPARLRALYIAADPALRIDQIGGAGTNMRGTIDGLRAAGIDVDILIGSARAAPTFAQIAAPRTMRRAPRVVRELTRDLRLMGHARSFASVDGRAYDVVYERSAYLIDAGRPIAARAGIPCLLESDGILVDSVKAAYGGRLLRRAQALESRKVRSADTVVVPSEASASHISESFGVPLNRVLVKGLGVEGEIFQVEAFGPVRDVGFAGTFQPYHGIDLLIAALSLRPSLRTLLIGDGPGASASRAPSVEMPGLLPRDEALGRLAACRVLVVPHSAENIYPVKLLEYGALGRPIVCPDLPAFDEFERLGPVFYRFRPRDPAALAAAIDAALDDDGRAGRFKQLVLGAYTWRAVGQRIAKRMAEVVSQ
jgi:glycosyltransferase involved in cell wall biosynthesis